MHFLQVEEYHKAGKNAIYSFDHPMLHAFLSMTMDERWAKRTPEEMFHTFHGFHGEGFRFILEDLLGLPTDVPVLVEGYKLLPRLVSPLLSRPDQAEALGPFSHQIFNSDLFPNILTGSLFPSRLNTSELE
jgi:hypothetical protein